MRGICRSVVMSTVSSLFVLVCGLPAESSLVEVPLFGPHEFTRESGPPQTSKHGFYVRTPGEHYLLKVRNGSPEQTHLVSSALITVNDITVFEQSDFDFMPAPWSSGPQAGVDEVGIGPLAGPVVAGAVVLDPPRPIDALPDSKTLTAKTPESAITL